MNITSATFSSIITPPMPKAAVQATDRPTPAASETNESLGSGKGTGFYSYETEPWKGKTYLYSENGGPQEERPLTKDLYLWKLNAFSRIELAIQKSHYSKIRSELGVFRPDLAAKNFSYTLGADGKIKILDPDQSLSESDVDYLTRRFNEQKGFNASVIDYAKTAMALVDHAEEFGGKYKLNLLNIQHTLDFGKLISTEPEKMYEALVLQILEKGEKREQLLVDVVV